MTSIRQIPLTHPLPDWRNFGVLLRILLGVNVVAMLLALAEADGPGRWVNRYADLAAWLEPLLLALLGLLALARGWLWRLPGRLAQGLVLGLAAAAAGLQYHFWSWLSLAEGSAFGAVRAMAMAVAAGGALLAYFELRARAFSPAIAEARLAALNARIRPHFLFNSLNTVLSLIRAEPKRAEAALEALADLFRSALRDPREMVPLADEIALGRQYLDLEKLRLGERLQAEWREDGEVRLEAPIPPLMLQPLLENAVYHGIEPAPAGGTVSIAIGVRGDELAIEIANPLPPGTPPSAGNHMALANIRERLSLYYDLEARLEIENPPGLYLVRIVLPCPSRKDR